MVFTASTAKECMIDGLMCRLRTPSATRRSSMVAAATSAKETTHIRISLRQEHGSGEVWSKGVLKSLQHRRPMQAFESFAAPEAEFAHFQSFAIDNQIWKSLDAVKCGDKFVGRHAAALDGFVSIINRIAAEQFRAVEAAVGPEIVLAQSRWMRKPRADVESVRLA